MTGVPVRNPEDGTDAWLGGITPVRGWSGRVTAAFSPVRPGGKDLGLLNTRNRRERWSERQRGPDAAGDGGQHTRHAPGWAASTIWSSGDTPPRGVAFYHGIADETVRVTFENMRYRLAFSVTKAVRHLHSAREVIEFVQEVEPHLRD